MSQECLDKSQKFKKNNQDKSKVPFELRLGDWILLACGLPLPLSFKEKAQNKYAQKKKQEWDGSKRAQTSRNQQK
jgi:hypothetical protein